MMGKEVKIGLSVIAVLLCVFGGVLYMRLAGNKTMPPVAKKTGQKSAKGDQARSAELPKGDKDEGAEADEPASGKGPSLRMVLPDQNNSAEQAGRENEGQDAWSESRPNAAAFDTPAEDDPATEERRPAVDRYGRRDGADGGFNAAAPGGRYGNDSLGRASDDFSSPASDESPDALPEESPAESDRESPAIGAGVFAGDSLQEGDGFTESSASLNGNRYETTPEQPGDGYRVADETFAPDEAEMTDLADNDPFPAASDARVPRSNQPSAGLQAADAEVPLAPIANSRREGLAANDKPPARNLDDRYGVDDRYRDAPSSGFAPVSDRHPARMEAEDRFASDVAGGLSDERDYASEDRFGGGDGAYVVQANDSFAAISKKVYGTDAYFQALHEFNRERYPNPDLLDVGDEIAVPDVEVLQQNYPSLCPKPRKSPLQERNGAMLLASQPGAARGGPIYLVAEGDTLFDIAKRRLGKASRWKEIYELNQDRLGEDFNYLAPGMELRMPGDRVKPDPVVERPLPGRLRR